MSKGTKWRHWRKQYWEARGAYQLMLMRHDKLEVKYRRLRRERGGYLWRLWCAMWNRG